jgi:hypothetical protein
MAAAQTELRSRHLLQARPHNRDGLLAGAISGACSRLADPAQLAHILGLAQPCQIHHCSRPRVIARVVPMRNVNLTLHLYSLALRFEVNRFEHGQGRSCRLAQELRVGFAPFVGTQILITRRLSQVPLKHIEGACVCALPAMCR